MEAPKCRTCGERHWSRLCFPVTKSVTVTPSVTPPVTTIVTPRQADLETENKRLRAEVERLLEEVRRLKQEIAQGRLLTAAERQRNSRARRKQAHDAV